MAVHSPPQHAPILAVRRRRAALPSRAGLTRLAAILAVSALVLTLLPAGRAAAEPTATAGTVTAPRLLARATLSADYLAPGPRSGAQATPANGRTGPFDGQVIPGFSAAVANPDGTFWAMPDNGFGTKANSTDFLLRLYLVRPRWDRGSGGGSIQIIRYLTLSDPNRKINFPIVREDSKQRWLTGGDFDIESLQRAADGSFWIGEEFGPFLLHVDPRGRVLARPVPSPLGKSPQNPLLGDTTPRTQASGGFEATAMSRDGRYLYPILEKALVGDRDPRRRVIAEFDTRQGTLHRAVGGTTASTPTPTWSPMPRSSTGRPCWCWNETTSTETPPSPNGSTGSNWAAPTAPPCWPRPSSSTC